MRMCDRLDDRGVKRLWIYFFVGPACMGEFYECIEQFITLSDDFVGFDWHSVDARRFLASSSGDGMIYLIS